MTKTQSLWLLHSEGCNAQEIALALGMKIGFVRLRLKRGPGSRVDQAFRGWRGWPLSSKVMSL